MRKQPNMRAVPTNQLAMVGEPYDAIDELVRRGKLKDIRRKRYFKRMQRLCKHIHPSIGRNPQDGKLDQNAQ